MAGCRRAYVLAKGASRVEQGDMAKRRIAKHTINVLADEHGGDERQGKHVGDATMTQVLGKKLDLNNRTLLEQKYGLPSCGRGAGPGVECILSRHDGYT